MKESILLYDNNSLAVEEATCCKGLGWFPTWVVLGVMDSCGS